MWSRILMAGVLLLAPMAARADGVDVDYDGTLLLLDLAMESIAETNPEVSESEIILLFGEDNDSNGINDEDQLAMLVAILMGNYDLNATTYGVPQIDAGRVSAIQAGFEANKDQAEDDLTIGGFTCILIESQGFSCNIAELLSGENEALGDGLLNFFAGYYTLGETGLNNFNGTGDDFPEVYFKTLLELAVRGTENEGLVDIVADEISFNPADYVRFGNAGSTNYLGAAGDIDQQGLTNINEYNATADREAWLNACTITPPLRVSTQPMGGDAFTGAPFTFELAAAGGVEALGEGVTQAQWSQTDSNGEDPVTTVVRALGTPLPLTIPFLTIPGGQTAYETTYFASLEDGIWTRGSLLANLNVTLDSNFRIVDQSASQTIAEGETLELFVQTAGGNAIPQSSWYLNNSFIANGPELTIESVTALDGGVYHCEIAGNTDGTKQAVTLRSEDIVVTVDGSGEGEGAPGGEGTVEGEGEGEGVLGEAEVSEGEGVADGEGVLDGEGMPMEGEAAPEGEAETEGEPEGEGNTEGVVEGEGDGATDGEGVTEGEGGAEGEGNSEGEGEAIADGEGLSEGEGTADGEGTAEGEGEGGGEGNEIDLGFVAEEILRAFFLLDDNFDRQLTLLEVRSLLDLLVDLNGGDQQFEPLRIFVELNLNGDRGLNVGELLTFAEASIVHGADTNASGQFDLSELLRVIQFFNAGAVYCSAEVGETTDGFQIDAGAQDCTPYTVDLLDQDWVISLSELLRVIQLFNIGPYEICEEQPDGVCPV